MIYACNTRPEPIIGPKYDEVIVGLALHDGRVKFDDRGEDLEAPEAPYGGVRASSAGFVCDRSSKRACTSTLVPGYVYMYT